MKKKLKMLTRCYLWRRKAQTSFSNLHGIFHTLGIPHSLISLGTPGRQIIQDIMGTLEVLSISDNEIQWLSHGSLY
jgi:hypothetical protein